MKKIGYIFLALIYNICSVLFPVKEKKIVLFNGHNHGLNGNLSEIYEKMKKRDADYQFVIVAKRDILAAAGKNKLHKIFSVLGGVFRFFVAFPYHMATAGKVFLNDNFIPLAFMHTEKKKTQFVQLWHGAGAFKRFGISTERREDVAGLVKRANKKITHLFVTSRQVIPYYEEAFGIPKERIYATGIPVTDLYFDFDRMEARRKKVLDQYPQFAEKKLLLYAPTFRAEEEENLQILQQFDVERVRRTLGDDWLILIKMHPKFPVENIPEKSYCYDMTDYRDISDLYLVSDLLVTDYSSTVVEYVLLNKPVVMFAYDLPKYDRGFYYDYENHVPGEVAHDFSELLQILSENYDNLEKRQNFVKFQYDNKYGGACEAILDILG